MFFKIPLMKWAAVNGRRVDNTMVKCKKTNNDQQYIKQKTEDSATRIPQKKERQWTYVFRMDRSFLLNRWHMIYYSCYESVGKTWMRTEWDCDKQTSEKQRQFDTPSTHIHDRHSPWRYLNKNGVVTGQPFPRYVLMLQLVTIFNTHNCIEYT